MLVLKGSGSFEGFTEPNGSFKGRDGLVREVVRVSHQVEKTPEDLETYEMNGRTLLFVRKGVLVQVEDELIRLGQGEFLKEVKRSLEKRLLERLKGYDPGMNKRIAEVFVDWSFEVDKSVILMILRSHSETAGPDL
ncbi:Na-translocating system protein MpsC family protein [Paenibacillus sp. CC-CFT747]|nr:Na-translocating system protein MpsC family protein [Paenibacillus sp. CC-CFT747]